jgi:hypothetical protein
MTEKNEAFHRLAQKRVDALTDQIRVFSNLAGPSYDWTAEEVWSYFSQVTAALETALGRFQEQKRWGAQPSNEEPGAGSRGGCRAARCGRSQAATATANDRRSNHGSQE